MFNESVIIMTQLTFGQNRQYWYVSSLQDVKDVSPTTAAGFALHPVFAITTCTRIPPEPLTPTLSPR